MTKKHGFTLIEIIIAVALFITIGTLTIPMTINFYNSQITNTTTEEIFSALKKAQSYSLYRRENSSHGVKFLENNFVVIRGDSYDSDSPLNEVFDLYSIEIDFGDPPPPDDLINFGLATGLPNWSGVITLTKGNITHQISICELTGLIEYGGSCEDND
ncbi:MAG TPA: type II secretion system protein [Candidatus Paceibacterota bacterium]|nr:type II secretion system protein [Candidatus Paceibacterota bacterium]